MTLATKLYLKLAYGKAAESEETTPASEDAPEPSGDDVDWSTLFDDTPVEEKSQPEPEEEEDKPEPEPAKAPEPPKVEESKPVEEVVPPVVPAAQPVKEEQQPEFDVAKYQSELESQYKLSPDEADLMLTKPEEIIPKLAAKMHLSVMKEVAQMWQSFQQTLPQVVETTQKAVSKKQEVYSAFTSEWPELAKPENEAIAVSCIKAVKQAFPDITLQDLIASSGELAYKRLKLPMPVKADGKAPPAKATVKPTPHKPAATKSGGESKGTVTLTAEEEFYAQIASGEL